MMEGAVNLAISQSTYSVIPAKAGIHSAFCGNYLLSSIKIKMDSRFRGNDEQEK